VISNPFNASFLIPSLLVASTVGLGFGIFVVTCVAEEDTSLVDVTPEDPQAANSMEVMNKSEIIFFISHVPSLHV
jgi:hypothetical protein